MIWESRYWKDELLRKADVFEKRQRQLHWREASFAKLEQDAMIAAYSMRKLIEAGKVSDAVRDVAIAARTFRATGEPVTRLNWHKLEEHFELLQPLVAQISVRELCNQLIHSYVFAPQVGDLGLDGFLVASDRERKSRLFEVRIADFVRLLRRVGSEYPTNLRMAWNEKEQDYDVTTGSAT